MMIADAVATPTPPAPTIPIRGPAIGGNLRTRAPGAPMRQTARTRGSRPRRAGGFPHERGGDEQPEAAAPGLLDPHRRVALLEPALQEDEPALEVVAQLGQLEARVEPHLLVGELVAPVPGVVAEQRPEDPAGHALDEVVAVEERAAVDREE